MLLGLSLSPTLVVRLSALRSGVSLVFLATHP
jgi:hypothetical protein